MPLIYQEEQMITLTPQEKLVSAYDLFGDTEETEVDFVLMGGSMGTENDTLAKAQKVVAIAALRKDCLAFVSPHKGAQISYSGAALSASAQRENTINFLDTNYIYFIRCS